MSENLVDSIMNGLGTVAPTIRFLVCPHCAGITEHPSTVMPPAACPKCGTATRMTVHPTREIADQKAHNIKEALEVMSKPFTPGAAAPNAAGPAFTTPKPEPHPMNPSTKSAEPVKPIEAAPAPPPKPAATTRKAKPAPAPVAAPAPEVAPVDPIHTALDQTDFKAVRNAAVEKFKYENKINGLDWTEVGVGEVFSVGFTLWQTVEGSRRPSYGFMEIIDTPASFRASLAEAKTVDPMVKIDVAQITGLSEALVPLVYGGVLVASIWDMKTGPMRVMAGTRVRLGAKVSKSGSLLWQVLGIAR
jgi:hypothetical protein